MTSGRRASAEAPQAKAHAVPEERVVEDVILACFTGAPITIGPWVDRAPIRIRGLRAAPAVRRATTRTGTTARANSPRGRRAGGETSSSLPDVPNADAAQIEVRHPVFARFFDRLSRLMEKEVGEQRDELLAGLSGRVVEIGAGNGSNFRHYPTTVEEVVALEPEAYLRDKADLAARRAPVPVSVRDGVADSLPFEQGEFDAAVASLVLCTVPDPGRALAELRRVVKPGGELRFLEHVRSGRPGKARLQERLDGSGIWPRLGGGCHCARDTVAATAAAGFHVERLRSFDLGPAWMHTNPHVVGVARAPQA